MESGFESIRRDRDESEIIPDRFGFKSASKKHINKNHERIGHVLGVEGEWLSVIKRRANLESRLPDIHEDLSLEQINFYREHYDFPPLTHDEYEAIKEQNTSSEVIKDEKLGEVLTEVDQPKIDLELQQEPTAAEEVSSTDTAPENLVEGEENTGEIIFENDDVENFKFNLQRYSGNDEMRFASIRDDLEELDLLDQSIDDILEQKGIPDIPSKSIKIGDKYFDWWDTHSSGYTYKELAIAQYYGINLDHLSFPVHSATLEPEIGVEQAPASENAGETSPGLEELGEALDSLVKKNATQDNEEKETGGALARIEGKIYPGEGELETLDNSVEIEQLKQEAREAIQRYKEFGDRHAPNLRTESIQDTYRQLEKVAWDKVEELSHKFDGHLSRKLPQLRDILIAHKDLTNISDAKDFLVNTETIKLNTEGNITHIVDNQNNSVELNRPRTFEEIFDKSRPVRILFRTDEEGKKIGYVVEGLNLNTPDWIAGVLSDNKFLEPIIVDPWDTPIEHILTNTEKESSLYPIDKTPKLTPAEEISNVQGKENIGDIFDQAEGGETIPQVSLDDLRLAYAKAEEAWNRKRGDEELEDAFESAREAYNIELERVLKLQVAKGQEANISQMFKNEVMSLRDSRTTQSQELQGKWEKRFNGAKEKFLGWATKNKRNWMITNAILFAGATGLSLTGAGIPVAGAVEMTRRSLGSVMSGVGARNTLVGLMEDRDININKGFVKIKFQAVVPKIVRESISESEEQIKQVSDEVLKDRLGILEAYYRLNGGRFTDNQQKAYEKVLTELGHRVRLNTLENYYRDQETSQNLGNDEAIESNLYQLKEPNNQVGQDSQSSEIVHGANFNFAEAGQSSRYTSELLNTISDKRIVELDKFRRKRKIANVVGFATTGFLGGLLLNDMVKPGSMFRPDIEGSGKPPTTGDPTPDTQGAGAGPASLGEASAPEAGADTTKPLTQPSTPTPGEGFYPPAPDLPSPEEALRMRQAAAAAEKAQQLAQDVSSLDSGETIWGEIAKQLGPDASQGQIQEAVEKYLGSIKGQDTIFKLAQQTEGGRELLSQWGIDNAGEVAGLSKEQLYEVSEYLGEGKLDGLTELSLDNLNALEQAEYVAPSPTEAPTIESESTETPAPPSAEDSVAPLTSEAQPVAPSEFTRSLSKALGTTNLTDSQIGSILEAYSDTDQGRKSLYNMIITSEANNSNISDLLTKYNVIDIYDFADLSDNQLYALAQEVGVENLDKLPGFELNEIILSKFEDAPDTVELVKGLSPLDAVQRYIANELGDLPYDSSLSKNIVDNILDTPEGKDWFLKSITENPDGAPAKGDIRFMNARLFFSRNGITQGSDIDWNKLDQLRNGFVKHKIFWQDFPFKVDDKTVNLSLSRLLKPGPMPGIKDAVRQVLTRQ